MNAHVVTRKAGRLSVGLARHRLLFPALYAAPAALRSPAAALHVLGLGRTRLAECERDYVSARDELFPALLERAREVAASEMIEKLERPELPAHDSKRLVYLAARLLRPRLVVETGTFSGVLSTFILRALAENGSGRLISFDLPAYEPIKDAIDHPLPPGQQPGWIIPEELWPRFHLVLGDARRTLPPALAAAGSFDLFVHDSLHTARHMLFEYRLAWRHLVPGGLLISDDVFRTPAFWWFTKRHGVPFVHIGNVGVARKRVEQPRERARSTVGAG